MYSRPFGQNGLPPDYGGVSFRREEQTAPVENDPSCAPPCAPRYPTEQRPRPIPSRSIRVKRAAPKMQEESKTEKRSGLSALGAHSFTMEDIVLAGLILLLLNSDCDSELLLILGFLLLVGLQ